MDFIFGTLATDKLRLLHHTLARTGIQHGDLIEPIDPKPGEPITLHVVTGGDFPATHVSIYYTTDGSVPDGSQGVASSGEALSFTATEITWDTPSWRFARHWQATLPAQPDNTMIRYRISAWTADGTEAYADWPELKATTEAAALKFFQGEDDFDFPPIGETHGTIFSIHVDTYTLPDWAKKAIMYQVFIDRFYPGDDNDWLQTEDIRGFYGGTLWGVRDKLDYITDLGVNVIWLSPTFASPSHHGYDTIDYKKTEPRMGGDAALKALIDAAHARGIKVLLDVACNHLSNEHPYFLDALNNPDSLYREWFTFDDSEIGYKTFFNVPTMPMVNTHSEAVREYMYGMAQYWIREFGVDGFRLDHANGPGSHFWPGFRKACREANPEAIIFGEIVEAPNILRTYAGRLDGLLDFSTEDALRKHYIYGTLSKDELDRFLTFNSQYYPDDFYMPTFLDNHDMNRFLFMVKGDTDTLKAAAQHQFTLRGAPIIYYGTEVGLSQNTDSQSGAGLDESRLPMPWGAFDEDLLQFYKDLITQRKAKMG